MKAGVVLAVLVIFTRSGSAQSVCRQAKSQIVEHRLEFTIQSVSLPSPSGPLHAKALIPDSRKAGDPTVFSFSTLLGSEPHRSVDMMPLAIELAKHGQATIVIERKLTWPDIAQSVGTMQSTVLCAEQWLSTHATVQPSHWRFVGPESDTPTFEQLHALGDTTSMTFSVWFPIGGPNENEDTENTLRDSSSMLNALLNPFLDGY